MKKALIMAVGLLFSTGAFAGADHYIRKDGNHIQHLKITKQKGDVRVLVDVDFDQDGQSCSEQIAGEAKVVSDNELTLKRQAQGEAHYCSLSIKLNGDEASIEESADCAKYFTGSVCRFGSEGKTLTKIK